MSFQTFPTAAAWQHQGARTGFEVAFFTRDGAGWRIDGCTTAAQDGQLWTVDYSITVGPDWTTRTANIAARSEHGHRSTSLAAANGQWHVDGRPAPELRGCLDVDLESSALTNTFPVHRGAADAPAAYVRTDLTVARLDQTYAEAAGTSYAYRSGDFTATLTFDEAGLITDYPGIAVRTA